MDQDNKQYTNSAGLIINIKTGEVSNSKQKLRLSPVNSRVLNVLLLGAKNAISRQQLFDAVWPNQVISDDALTRCISDLRSQLKGLATSDPLIETIPKVGYRWLPDIETAVPDKNTTINSDNSTSFWSQNLKPMLTAFVTLVIILWGLLGWFYFSSKPSTTPVVILPTKSSQTTHSTDNPFDVSAYLKSAVVNQNNMQYLSNFAIESYSGNPFPYYSHQFGVRWFIESHISKNNNQNTLTLNLIDAKTALVVYSQQHRFEQASELKTLCQKFVFFVSKI